MKHQISTKNKYIIIYIIVAVVMAVRCMNVKVIIKNADALTVILMIALFAAFLAWGCIVIRITDEYNNYDLFALLIFFTVMSASIFTGEDYTGSAESIMLVIMLFSVLIIVQRRGNALMCLLSIPGIIVSTDYFFEYMGIIYVLLIYRTLQDIHRKKHDLEAYENEGTAFVNMINNSIKTDKKIIIFNIVFSVIAYILCAYHHVGYYYKRAAYSIFPELSVCLLRIAVTVVLLSPFIAFFVILYKRIIRMAAALENDMRMFYKLMPYGFLLAIPLFFMSNNYGTVFFAIIAYHVIIIFGLIFMGDGIVYSAYTTIIKDIKTKHKWLILLMIYAVLFTPVDSVKICYFVDSFINW